MISGIPGKCKVFSLMRLSRLLDSENDLRHTWHLYGFSPVWVLVCHFRLSLQAYDFWHNWHLYGFFPVWVFICVFRSPPRANEIWHNWHLHGFSPVWVRMCLLRSPPRVNEIWHNRHLYGFSPVWVLFSPERWANDFKHTRHLNDLSPVCSFMCIFWLGLGYWLEQIIADAMGTCMFSHLLWVLTIMHHQPMYFSELFST